MLPPSGEVPFYMDTMGREVQAVSFLLYKHGKLFKWLLQ